MTDITQFKLSQSKSRKHSASTSYREVCFLVGQYHCVLLQLFLLFPKLFGELLLLGYFMLHTITKYEVDKLVDALSMD